MRSYRSVVTSHVNRVVRLSVSTISFVSPVDYHVAQLFLFPTWASEGVLFFCFVCFFECGIECHIPSRRT